MVYVDPYVYNPGRQRAQLRLFVGASAASHALGLVLVLAFAGSRFFEADEPPPPPRVVQVSLVAASPKEIQRSLPDKVTAAPAPPPAKEEVVNIPEPKPEEKPPDKPAEKEPEPKPKPKEEPKTEDLDAVKQRLASLKSRLQNQKGDETPVPNAPVATRNRPPAGETGAGSHSDVKSYAADSPEGRYLGAIKDAVVAAWIPNKRLIKERPDLTVIIAVALSKDGRLVIDPSQDAAIEQSSGDLSFDLSALRAARIVAQQGRFPSPPESLLGEPVGLRFLAKDAK